MELLGQREIIEKTVGFYYFFAMWGVRGGIRESFGTLGGSCGGALGHQGSPEGSQGAPVGPLGAHWGSIGALWRAIGAPWGPSGNPWGPKAPPHYSPRIPKLSLMPHLTPTLRKSNKNLRLFNDFTLPQ